MIRRLASLVCLIGSLAFAAPQAPVRSEAEADGAAVHFTSTGTGPRTLIFVHGWTCDETSWAKQVPAFARAYRVITMDLPGHGRSELPKDGVYSMSRFARAVEAVRAAANVSEAVFVGHSMGVPVIARYAQDYPGHARSLVFVDGLLHDAQIRAEGRKYVTTQVGSARNWREEAITSLFSAHMAPADRQHVLGMMLKPPDVVARRALLALYDDAAIGERVVDLPVYGIFSAAVKDEYLTLTKALFPALRYDRMPDTGHFLMIERAEEFNRLLLEYLRAASF